MSQWPSTKARRVLGWEPKTSFEALIEMMWKSDLELVSSPVRRTTPSAAQYVGKGG